MAPLQTEDGHDQCPACLGVEHLRTGMSDNPCMNCRFMPLAVRRARLAAVEGDAALLPVSGSAVPRAPKGRGRRRSTASHGPPGKVKKVDTLALKVDTLSSEFAQIKELLLNLQPDDRGPVVSGDSATRGSPVRDIDVLSTAASCSLFDDEGEGQDEDKDSALPASDALSQGSDGSLRGSEAGHATLKPAIRMALARLGLDDAPATAAPSSAFFRQTPQPAAFSVPPSKPYIEELQRCWGDPKLLSHHTSDSRNLAAMQEAGSYGLDRMAPVDPTIASLIVSPDEALRPDARCPRPQCRMTDDLLVRAYNIAARMGRIGNSFSHLILGLSQVLQESGVDSSAQTLSHMFGPAAQLALERSAQVDQVYSRGPLTIQGIMISAAGLSHGHFSKCQGDQPPVVAPPKAPGGGGGGPEAQRAGVGRFTQQHISYWERETTDPWVVSTLSKGYTLQFRRRPPTFCGVKMSVVRDPTKSLALSRELASLLDKDAIEPVVGHTRLNGFYSVYFLIPKKDGGFRPILDLRGLNRFLKVLPFRMLRMADVLQSVAQGAWFVSIDLKDAYFHVPIAPHHRQFLRFAFQGRAYQFKVMPFGLSLAPRIFTRCVAAALAPIQARGLAVLPYLDDWLIVSPTAEQAVRDTAVLLGHVNQLGLTVNYSKSSLTPSQKVDYLGMTLDSRLMRAFLSRKRVENILQLIGCFQRGRVLRYGLFLKLLGMLTAASMVIPLGLLSLRPLQVWVNTLHLDPKWHRGRRVRVSSPCCRALKPWRRRGYLVGGVPLGVTPARREVVETDASLLGWGAVWQHRTINGRWSTQHRWEHINVLELRAIFFALQHFLPVLKGRHVLIRTDSTSAVYHINHQGGTRSKLGLRVSEQLLTWAFPHFLSLRAVHLPGVQNNVADVLSRQGPPQGDWRLHPEVVEMIWSRYGRAEVDVFASETSTHCPLWYSLMEGTSPLGQDALAHAWPAHLLYAFPPIPLIRATLESVQRNDHRLLLVAPNWPGRPWFPVLLKLLQGEPWRLPRRPDLLSQLEGRIWHPNPDRLQLWIWPLGARNHSWHPVTSQ
ncbi:uncharacterized protein LOC115593839 [Sparus aurata]|uniref:uncharacterized protein LOC115593839 n=1 Tax=Sparus aurata TaxID=8175 RepID=UPI0011C156E0|nr:uncharacterized protein LOC115593839 [Sparus aurata]